MLRLAYNNDKIHAISRIFSLHFINGPYWILFF